jgi:uncharacterized protein YjbI with pentapeptide repeats
MKDELPITLPERANHLDLLMSGREKWNMFRTTHPEFRPDLRSTDLRNRDLTGYNLRYARLCGSNLSGVNLTGSDLTAADLRGTIMEGATIEDTDLTDVQYQCVLSIAGAKLKVNGVKITLEPEFVNWALEYGANKSEQNTRMV